MKQQVYGQRKHLVRIGLQRIPRERSRLQPAFRLDVRGLGFEQVIHLIAAHLRRTARPPRIPIKRHQPGLPRLLHVRPAFDQDGPRHKRQFMILLQEEHDAVLQLDALRLLRLELLERGNGNLLPRLRLLPVHRNGTTHSEHRTSENTRRPPCSNKTAVILSGGWGAVCSNKTAVILSGGWRAVCANRSRRTCIWKSRAHRESTNEINHCAPPFSPAAAACFGASVSINPTVRLPSTNTLFATLLISAFVTLSTLSSCRNSSRQSPYRVWYWASASASPWLSASPRSRSARVRVLYMASSSSVTSVVLSLSISLWIAVAISSGECPGSGTA